jgi:hypothetical protein
MIHSTRIEEVIATANPYYLLCDGVPLPLAIAAGTPEAVQFRDEWVATHAQEERDFCGYCEAEKNFIGGRPVKNGRAA